MKFRRILLLFLSVAFPAFSNVHADLYDVQALTAHLRQKLGNIQAEYQRLRDGKQLQYLWDEDKRKINNLFLNFFGKDNITSAEDVKQQTETLFAFEDPNSKEQLEEFLRVFTSKDFLRMLFSDAVVNRLADYSHPDICSFFWWDKEHSENPSEVFFSLRARQARHEDIGFIGMKISALLDITFMFAYDTQNNTVRFIGLKNQPIVNAKYADGVILPIYSRSNAETSVQKSNLMDVD